MHPHPDPFPPAPAAPVIPRAARVRRVRVREGYGCIDPPPQVYTRTLRAPVPVELSPGPTSVVVLRGAHVVRYTSYVHSFLLHRRRMDARCLRRSSTWRVSCRKQFLSFRRAAKHRGQKPHELGAGGGMPPKKPKPAEPKPSKSISALLGAVKTVVVNPQHMKQYHGRQLLIPGKFWDGCKNYDKADAEKMYPVVVRDSQADRKPPGRGYDKQPMLRLEVEGSAANTVDPEQEIWIGIKQFAEFVTVDNQRLEELRVKETAAAAERSAATSYAAAPFLVEGPSACAPACASTQAHRESHRQAHMHAGRRPARSHTQAHALVRWSSCAAWRACVCRP